MKTREQWFEAHPEAKLALEAYVAARRDGSQTMGWRAFGDHLKDEYGYPFGPPDGGQDANFGAWMRAKFFGHRAPSNEPEQRAERRAERRVERPPMTDEEALAEDRARHESHAALGKSKQVIRALERELRDTQERAAFVDALEGVHPEPLVIERHDGQGHRLPAGSYVMLASDWHMGERVRGETVAWRNEYSPEIAQERAAQFFKSNLRLLNAARSAWDIRDAVLWLGGDLITGYIHEEYQEENFLSPTEESLLCYDTLVAGIKGFLAASEVARLVIPTSNGNHGRTTAKKRVSSSHKNSYEWMLYQLLAKHFTDEPRVRFQIAAGYHNILDVYGFKIRFHHGDQIGYGGGIGGLSIPANRRIGRQAQKDPERVDLDCFGHFHQRTYPGMFIGNGSLIGWNAFADAIGCAYEPPAQTSFVVDERYRLVSNYNAVIVQKERK